MLRWPSSEKKASTKLPVSTDLRRHSVQGTEHRQIDKECVSERVNGCQCMHAKVCERE